MINMFNMIEITAVILTSTHTKTSEDTKFITFLHASNFNPIIQERVKDTESALIVHV